MLGCCGRKRSWPIIKQYTNKNCLEELAKTIKKGQLVFGLTFKSGPSQAEEVFGTNP